MTEDFRLEDYIGTGKQSRKRKNYNLRGQGLGTVQDWSYNGNYFNSTGVAGGYSTTTVTMDGLNESSFTSQPAVYMTAASINAMDIPSSN